MKGTSHQPTCSRYIFRGRTGYVVAPWLDGATNDWVYIRQSASVPPWVDQDVHLDTVAEEYFFALRGTRVLRIEERIVDINEGELLEVSPGTQHVLHATHPPFQGIEFRVPQQDDKVLF